MVADCLDELALQELAAGIAPAGFFEEHREHITYCNRCASILKTYLAAFSDEMTAEEEAILNELRSSKPKGQKRLLKKLLQPYESKPGGALKLFYQQWRTSLRQRVTRIWQLFR